jgi:hypothetical protein
LENRITWTKIAGKSILIVDQKNLEVNEHVALFDQIGNLIPNSGKVNVIVILDMTQSVMSSNVMRAAQSAMYRTIGFVHEVIVIADPRTQSFIDESFSKQSFFKLRLASSLEEAKRMIYQPVKEAPFFSFSGLLRRPSR